MQQVMPHNLRKLKLYTDDTPLFTRFQIETQIENAFERQVRLPSGGSIVIDQTEALTAIDINSAQAPPRAATSRKPRSTPTAKRPIEIARQLRIRDARRPDRHRLHRHGLAASTSATSRTSCATRCKLDRARVQIGRISRFGLLEMSRQRLRPSLGEASQIVCPRCEGHGRIRSVESLSLSILRLVEEHAMKENTGQVLVQAPSTVANFLLNEKRKQRRRDRSAPRCRRSSSSPTTSWKRRISKSSACANRRSARKPSRATSARRPAQPTPLPQMLRPSEEPEQPAVAGVVRATPAPERPDMAEATPATATATVVAAAPATNGGGFLSKIFGLFRSGPITAPTPVAAKPASTARPAQQRPQAARDAGSQRGASANRSQSQRSSRQDGSAHRPAVAISAVPKAAIRNRRNSRRAAINVAMNVPVARPVSSPLCRRVRLRNARKASRNRSQQLRPQPPLPPLQRSRLRRRRQRSRHPLSRRNAP